MSNEYKFAIKATIDELHNKSTWEAFNFFSRNLGEPYEITMANGELQDFKYKGMYQVLYNEKTKDWEVEITLIEESEEDINFNIDEMMIDNEEIEFLITQLTEVFDIDKENIQTVLK